MGTMFGVFEIYLQWRCCEYSGAYYDHYVDAIPKPLCTTYAVPARYTLVVC